MSWILAAALLAGPPSAVPPTAAPPAAVPRAVQRDPESSANAGGGWIPLFDGESLDGWTPKFRGLPLGEDPHRTFRVADGVLRVDYGGWEGDFDGRFGHLFHEDEWSYYRMRVEVRFTGEQHPGAPGWAWRNSGIMLHGQPAKSMDVDQSFPVSIEVQLLGGAVPDEDAGDDAVPERPTANLCTPGTDVEMGGERVTRHCTDSMSKTVRGDAWVTVEVEVRGAESIRHFVDGEVVMEYARPRLDPNDADARPLIEGGALLLHRGTISLQAESHPVEFRRVEIRPLPEEEVVRAEEAFYAAFEAGDAEEVARRTAPEFLHYGVDGSIVDGDTWMRDFYAPLAEATRAGDFHWKVLRREVETVRRSGDVAHVMGRATLQRHDSPAPRTLAFTHVWQKRDGLWKRLAYHNHWVDEDAAKD